MKIQLFALTIFGLALGTSPSLANPPTPIDSQIVTPLDPNGFNPQLNPTVPAVNLPIQTIPTQLSQITDGSPSVGNLPVVSPGISDQIANVVSSAKTSIAGVVQNVSKNIAAGLSPYLDGVLGVVNGVNDLIGSLFGGNNTQQAQSTAASQSAAHANQGIAVAGAAAQNSNGDIAAMNDAISRVDTSSYGIAQSAEFVAGTRAVANGIQSTGSNAQTAEFIANGTNIVANAGLSPQAQIQAAQEKTAAATNAAAAATMAGSQHDNSLDELSDIKQLLAKQMETQAIQTNKLTDLNTLTAAGLRQQAENARQQAIAEQELDRHHNRLIDRRIQGNATILGLAGMSAPTTTLTPTPSPTTPP
jgi:hypothetical protein